MELLYFSGHSIDKHNHKSIDHTTHKTRHKQSKQATNFIKTNYLGFKKLRLRYTITVQLVKFEITQYIIRTLLF